MEFTKKEIQYEIVRILNEAEMYPKGFEAKKVNYVKSLVIQALTQNYDGIRPDEIISHDIEDGYLVIKVKYKKEYSGVDGKRSKVWLAIDDELRQKRNTPPYDFKIFPWGIDISDGYIYFSFYRGG